METSEDEPFKDFDDFELTAINEVEAASTSRQEESARPKARKQLAFENQQLTTSTKKTLTSGQEESAEPKAKKVFAWPLKAALTSGQKKSTCLKAQKGLAFENQQLTTSTKKPSTSGQEESARSKAKKVFAWPLKAASTSGQKKSTCFKAQKGLAFENQQPTACTKKTFCKKTVVNPEEQSVKTISVKVKDPTCEKLCSENLQSHSLFNSDVMAETNTVSPIKYTYRVEEKTVYTMPDKIATRVVSKQWVEATCLSLRDEQFK